MSEIKDGGPAFPFNRTEAECYGGMSLRDYFAAAALQGMCASAANGVHRLDDLPIIAATSYRYADAMLKAREVKP